MITLYIYSYGRSRQTTGMAPGNYIDVPRDSRSSSSSSSSNPPLPRRPVAGVGDGRRQRCCKSVHRTRVTMVIVGYSNRIYVHVLHVWQCSLFNPEVNPFTRKLSFGKGFYPAHITTACGAVPLVFFRLRSHALGKTCMHLIGRVNYLLVARQRYSRYISVFFGFSEFCR